MKDGCVRQQLMTMKQMRDYITRQTLLPSATH